jgi:hypothetical protein
VVRVFNTELVKFTFQTCMEATRAPLISWNRRRAKKRKSAPYIVKSVSGRSGMRAVDRVDPSVYVNVSVMSLSVTAKMAKDVLIYSKAVSATDSHALWTVTCSRGLHGVRAARAVMVVRKHVPAKSK